MIVPVLHPVLHRFRLRRARTDRFAFGSGVTPVELREVSERPREVVRIGETRILSAEGTTWRPLRQGRANVAPADLAAFLADPVTRTYGNRTVLDLWAARSPLLYQDDRAKERIGYADVSGAAFSEGAEQASTDVHAFLSDRVRLHGDRVLVRDERLVGLGDLFRSTPWTAMGDWSRDEGTTQYSRYVATLAVRPDRLAALWEMKGGKRRAPVPEGPWDALAPIPGELLRDDDVAWMANRLPSTILRSTRDVLRDVRGAPDGPIGRFLSLVPALEALDRRSFTHAIAGAEVAPALETAREAASLYLDIRRDAVRAKPDPEDDVHVRSFRYVLDALDMEHLPRLHGRPRPARDEEILGGLAPGPRP
jgi:hypothetical protein